MDNVKKYYAFISYKREDEEWAKWLQHKLEHYKLPSNLNGRTDLPKEIRPIFRDQSELAGGVLADEIQSALEASKYLIVICSPRAAQSPWVDKEVQSFIDMGRTDKIIPFIVGGTAHAQKPEDECFPSALLSLPPNQELLGINIDEKGRDAAAVKVVARMFGLEYDHLWEQYSNNLKSRKRRITVAIAVILIAVVSLFSKVIMERRSASKVERENHTNEIAELSYDLVEQGDSYLAQRLLLEALSDTYTIKAEAALRNAALHNYADLGVCEDANFSSNGKLVVTAAKDSIKIWDAQTGEMVKKIGGIKENWDNYWRYSVFSPDGKRIVSAHGDTIVIWDVAKGGAVLTRVEDRKSRSLSASFSPDGKRIVSLLENNNIKIWDVETGEDIWVLTRHVGGRIPPSFSNDGKYILSESQDTIWIWNVLKGEECYALDHFNQPLVARFGPKGKLITLANYDKISVWDFENEKIIKTISEDGYLSDVCFSPNGDWIISTSIKSVKIRCSTNWEETRRFIVPGNTLFSLYRSQINANGKHLLVQASGGHMLLINMEWQNYKVLQGSPVRSENKDYNCRAIFSQDGKYVAASSTYGPVKIWDARTGELLPYTLNPRQGNEIRNIMFDHYNLLCCFLESAAIVWNVETNKIVSKIQPSEFGELIAVSQDFKKSLYSFRKHLICYDEKGNELWKIKEAHNHDITTASFSPDGKMIVTTAKESVIKIWDSETGALLHTLSGHANIVNAAVFNSDGTMIASTSEDFTIKIWDVEREKAIHTFPSDLERSVFFSPDDRYVISPSGVWDIQTETLMQFIDADSYACFSPDGRSIVTANSDGSILLWNYPTLKELMENTRNKYKNQPLTDKERNLYMNPTKK